MSNWKTCIEAKLAQGKKPTYDELEAALLGALEERKLFISHANDQAATLLSVLEQHKSLIATTEVQTQALDEMTQWLGKIADAFIKHDGGRMTDTVRDFVQERVIVVDKPAKGKVH